MAVLIFKLRYVPDDEAQDIRELLSENGIDYYETSAGILGISVPGLWLKSKDQLEIARQLIDDYQKVRQNQAREEYNLRRRQGTARTFMDILKENPARYISSILAILLICYFMIIIFIRLAG
jgi:hypothetical protein